MNTEKNIKILGILLLLLSNVFTSRFANAIDLPVRCDLQSMVFSYVRNGEVVDTEIIDVQHKLIDTLYSNWWIRSLMESFDEIELHVITGCMAERGATPFPGVSVVIEDPVTKIISSSYSSFWESDQKVKVQFLKKNLPPVLPNEIKRDYFKRITCSWSGIAEASDCGYERGHTRAAEESSRVFLIR